MTQIQIQSNLFSTIKTWNCFDYNVGKCKDFQGCMNNFVWRCIAYFPASLDFTWKHCNKDGISSPVRMCQAKGHRGQQNKLAQSKTAVKQQQRCRESRWLHSLQSVAADITDNALNPLYTCMDPHWCIETLFAHKLSFKFCWRYLQALQVSSPVKYAAALWWLNEISGPLKHLPPAFL